MKLAEEEQKKKLAAEEQKKKVEEEEAEARRQELLKQQAALVKVKQEGSKAKGIGAQGGTFYIVGDAPAENPEFIDVDASPYEEAESRLKAEAAGGAGVEASGVPFAGAQT